jgi:hypothetical protein
MKRRLGLLAVSLFAVGSLQVVAAPAASACADPHCPWSPVTGFVKQTVERVHKLCNEIVYPECPL